MKRVFTILALLSFLVFATDAPRSEAATTLCGCQTKICGSSPSGCTRWCCWLTGGSCYEGYNHCAYSECVTTNFCEPN